MDSGQTNLTCDTTDLLPDDPRFWSYVDKTETCWLWTRSTTSTGYGQVNRPKVSSHPLAAHRYSWLLTRGPIPDGLIVRHTCDMPLCVRPEHLLLGTKAQNSRDMVERGRHREAALRRAKVTPEKVIEMRARYAAGGVTYRSLAAEYGLDFANVGHIIRRRTWTHI